MAYEAVSVIVSDAAVELGLGAITDVFASTDPNVIQLRGLLKSAGRKLVRERIWKHLQLEYTFVTAAAASYALPADFRCLVPATGWNRTSVLSLGGPLEGEGWQYIQAGLVLPTTLFVRIWQGRMYVEPDSDTGSTVAFEYGTIYWVAEASSTTPASDGPDENDDVILFDPDLAVMALKLAWLKAKQFDTTSTQDDYDTALAAAASADSTSPKIYLGGGRRRRIVWPSIPDSGVGS